MSSRVCIAVFAASLCACGISKDEHDRLLGEAASAQKQAYQAEMKKAQEGCDADKRTMVKGHTDLVATKDLLIDGLEKEVEKQGGDLASVRIELGAQVTELASAQVRLNSTQTQLDTTKTELATKSEKLEATTEELIQLSKRRLEAEKEAAQFRALAQRLKSMVDAGQLSVEMRDGRINLKLPDNVLFPSGSRKLKKEGRAALVEVAKVLKDVDDREFLIAGHTDNVPLRRGGRFKDNWELSTARAVSVVALLVKEGVPPQRLAAAGFGEYDPIADNDSRESKAKNRRLEIILLPNIEQVDL